MTPEEGDFSCSWLSAFWPRLCLFYWLLTLLVRVVHPFSRLKLVQNLAVWRKGPLETLETQSRPSVIILSSNPHDHMK